MSLTEKTGIALAAGAAEVIDMLVTSAKADAEVPKDAHVIIDAAAVLLKSHFALMGRITSLMEQAAQFQILRTDDGK